MKTRYILLVALIFIFTGSILIDTTSLEITSIVLMVIGGATMFFTSYITYLDNNIKF